MDKITERKELREKILQGLYDYHFENKGKMKQVSNENKDDETKLAYLYLAEKGLVELENFEHPAFAGAKINAFGIDEIEKD